MEITSETIEKIIELSRPEAINIEGSKYTTRPVYYNADPLAKARSACSLSAVVDYLNDNPDQLLSCLIEIASRSVQVVSPLNADKNRDAYLTAKPNTINLPLNQFIDLETFRVMLMSDFVQDENTELLLGFLSSLCEESKGTIEDDGATQTITAKQGVASLAYVKVPNPITLRPFRTFYDIAQPESQFVFRMKEGPRAALFEADGGAWCGVEVAEIKAYLQKQLSKTDGDLEITLLG